MNLMRLGSRTLAHVNGKSKETEMNTALMVDHEKRNKELNERMLDARIKAFIANYRPKEGWEQTDFEGDLLMLVRQIYADAQAPLLKQITDMCAAMPVIIPKHP